MRLHKYVNNYAIIMFFFQFYNMAIVAIIHKKNEPNLGIMSCQNQGPIILKVLLCFGNL